MNKKIIRILSLLVALVCIVCTLPLSVSAKGLDKKGTEDEPYLIESIDDLIALKDAVHAGDDMKGVYFLQTVDLDLATDERTKIWEPIGTVVEGEENFFFGIYNGGGHVIRNLNTEASVSGFFSFLGGTVMNLGIESGHVKGDYVGAIASHATGGTAKIINCYSLASVSGIRAGGLADNFHGGTIADSFAAPTLDGSEAVGGLVSYGVTNVIDSCCVGDYEPIGMDRAIVLAGKVEAIPKSDETIEALKEKFRNASVANTTPIKQLALITDGDGSRADPFVITSAEQLSHVAFLVNIGNGTNFFGNWFVQKNDIDLSSIESWQPIGTESSIFGGVYDGGGHKISGLNVRGEAGKYVGLFGYIQGTVMNLGIESGTIEGDYAASLVGKSTGASMIVNCYNNATVIGKISAAGIANSFYGGLIVNCLNTGSVSSEGKAAGICAEAVTRMENCYSVGLPVSHTDTEGIVRASCRQVESAGEAAKLLNANLYSAATVSGYQRNNLVKWSSDGRLTQNAHNYLSRFILQEILIALIVFALIFLCYIIYRTSTRTSSLKLVECKNTLTLEKERFFSSRDSRIQSVVTLGFVFTFVMILVGIINQDSAITFAFSWPDQGDAFMDFFNPMHTVLNGNYSEAGHYTDIKSTYPPIIKGILWLFAQILPKNMQILGAKAIRSTTVGILIAVISFMLCYFILYALFKGFTNKKSKLVPLFALFSSPMIFLLDRGNTLFFVLVLCALFVAGYRSKNPLMRHLSYACLGLAAAIKIYPAILGLLVLREKKWKDTLWCLGYGAAFCIVPFFIIGIDELLLYVRNVTSSFDKNSAGERYWLIDYTHVLTNVCDFLGSKAIGATLAKITLYPFTVLLALCAVLSKQRWKAVLAVMLIQILFPGFSVYYCAALLAIPLMLLIGSEEKRKIDYVYAALLVLALVPLQFLCGALGVSQEQIWQVGGLAGLAASIVLIVDCATEIIKTYKKKNA